MDEQKTASKDDRRGKTQALFFSVFAIGTCGLIYELLAGTIASYMLGDSVTQFSTIIGVYLFSMGLGSYLSRYIRKDLIAGFIQVEILVGLIGGVSSLVLFLAFAEFDAFRVVLYSWVAVIGILVGLEIPLVLRILEDRFPFRDLISKVLSLDYLGALAASLLFPLWLVPQVGLMRSSFVFGVLNVLVAIWTCHLFRKEHRRPMLTVQAYAALVLLLVGVAFSEVLLEFSEQRLLPPRKGVSRHPEMATMNQHHGFSASGLKVSGPHHIEDVRQWLQAAHLAVREVVAPSVQQPRDLGGFGPACMLAQLRLLARRQRTAQVATANQEVAIDARKSTDQVWA